MSRYRKNKILPAILAIVVIIVAVAGLIGLGRLLFVGSGSGNTAQSAEDVNEPRDALLDTSVGSSVTMNVRGPIVADENFRSFQITVTPSSRDVKTFTGYLDGVIDQESLPNNVAAYTEFVYALDKAKLTAGTQFEGDKNDIRGICAVGRVTQFIISRGGEPVQTLWTSTCGGSKGSLKANVEQLSQLFTRQIPNAPNYISKLSIN